MIALGRRAANTLLVATGERTHKQEQYRKRRRTRKHIQRETTYVAIDRRRTRKHTQRETTYIRRQEKGRASIINRKRQWREGHVGKIAKTKDRRS